MATEPENLEPLVSLLKSKQTPHPPKRFFDQMSNRIRDGIQHPRPPVARTWWQRLITDMDMKACAAGIAVCSLMLLGIAYAMNLDMSTPAAVPPYATLDSPNRIAPATLVVVPALPNRLELATEPAAPSMAPVVAEDPTNSPFVRLPAAGSLPINYWHENETR